MPTKPTDQLTLTDRLSRLTYAQACRLLGADAPALLRAGGAIEIMLEEQVRIEGDRFLLELAGARRDRTRERGTPRSRLAVQRV